jgi:hypothetical protein
MVAPNCGIHANYVAKRAGVGALAWYSVGRWGAGVTVAQRAGHKPNADIFESSDLTPVTHNCGGGMNAVQNA